MAELPERPDTPVFVDNSGGRRRRWRRLGLAMGVAGGGYALVVAVSVIGGNSDAPWVLIPGTGNEASGSARVVPKQDKEADTGIPAGETGAASGDQPSASASASAGDGSPTSAGSTHSTREASSDSRAKGTPTGGKGTGSAGMGNGNATGQPAGVPPVIVDPGTEPTQSADPGPTDTPPDPTEEPPPEESSSGGVGGLLEDVVDGLGGILGAGAE